MGKIVWLASYPKSGNTWMRLLLASYFGEGGPDINRIELDGNIASSRRIFDELMGVDATDLSPAVLKMARGELQRVRAEEFSGRLFSKTHDLYDPVIFPVDVCEVAVVIVRNPLDIVSSFANHMGWSLDKTIRSMNCPRLCLTSNPSRLSEQLSQHISTWHDNVSSWLGSECRTVLVRYEDMLEDTVRELTRVLSALDGEVPDPVRVQRSVDSCAFNKLKAQEENEGFCERPAKSRAFFRQGLKGEWRNELSIDQGRIIVQQHGDMMKKMGYFLPEELA